MAIAPLNRVIHHLLAAGGDDIRVTDGELLTRFLAGRDDVALAALVRRHAAMVWGVCRRQLPRQQDAEDAFQATFLVLVRKAASVNPPNAVGNWLYGVAHKTALRVRTAAAKTARRERQVDAMPDLPTSPPEDTDLRHAVDAEVARLPDRYREVVVLCDLQGLTRKEAAGRLGLPEGTVASRLNRARALLGKRFVRLGAIAVGAGPLALPTPLLASTIQLTTTYAAGQAAGVVPAGVSALTERVLFTMTMKKITTGVVLLCAALTVGVGGYFTATGAEPASAVAQEKKAAPPDRKVKTPNEKPADNPPDASVIRLGAKRDDIIRRFGKPYETATFASGIESLRFQNGPDARTFVEVAPKSGRVIQIFYKKKTPFTPAEIKALLDRNAEGSEWIVSPLADGSTDYRRKDGGSARGGDLNKIDDVYQFAVLTSGNVLNKK